MIPLGIKAFVDFAFKMIFGSPENSVALIGLLNAILELEHPITEVTILNPFSRKEFETDKFMVLDIKARDSAGRLFNIEMQISLHPGLMQRMVYYVSELYTDQLSEGDDYTKLNTTISICLLLNNLFHDSDQAHHRFQLMDEKSGRKLDRTIEVHTVELQKIQFDETTISNASRFAQWCWLIVNAHKYTADDLRRMFPDLEFQPAIRCLETISSKTEDKAMHDHRDKVQRDYDWMLSTVRTQGIEQGREEGLEEGIERGREEGTIQTLQQILGDVVSDNQELSRHSDIELKTKLAELQERVRSRLS